MASKGLTQAYQVQDIVYNAIQTFRQQREVDGKLILKQGDAKALQSLVNAFVTAQDRVRIQRGKPLPGALKPEPKRKHAKVSLSSVLPMSDPEPEQTQASVG